MAMSGSITEMSLVDLIQLACMERYTARLTVNRGEESARIFFSKGEIVHAELGDKTGPDALYEAVSWTTGDFNLDRGIETDQATIQGTWTAHLLEALVRIDHGKKDAIEQEQGSRVTMSPVAGSSPDPQPVQPAASRPSSSTAADATGGEWLKDLRRLNGVDNLVLVRTDGMPHEFAAAGQDEQASALAAFIGNAAKGIGMTLNLGSLDRAEVLVGGVPRVVLACDDCYAGLEIKKDHNPHHVALEARRILLERD